MSPQTAIYVSLGLTALGIFVAVTFNVLSRRKQRLPRITVRTSVAAILGTTSLGTDVAISLGPASIRVKDPWTARIVLEVLPIKDISETAFEGTPLRLNFGAPVVWVADTSGHRDAESIKKQWRDARIEPGSGVLRVQQPEPTNELPLPPAPMKRKAVWSVSVVCEGKPQPTVPDQLTDVDLELASEYKSARRDFLQGATVASAAILLLVIAGFLKPGGSPKTTLTPLLLAVFIISGAALGSGLTALTVTYQRWRATRP